MPEACVALPATTASAPTTSEKYWAASDAIAGLSTRSISCANAAAVTLVPVLKRNVRLSSNVYVLPSGETVGV